MPSSPDDEYFLEKFRQLDTTDREAQKKLVEVFVNAIYVYDDHLKIAFNYTEGGGCHTVTLSDIEKADTCDNGSHVSTEASTRGFEPPTYRLGGGRQAVHQDASDMYLILFFPYRQALCAESEQ